MFNLYKKKHAAIVNDQSIPEFIIGTRESRILLLTKSVEKPSKHTPSVGERRFSALISRDGTASTAISSASAGGMVTAIYLRFYLKIFNRVYHHFLESRY